MSWEVRLDWRGRTCLVRRLHAAERGPAASFEYSPEWLNRAGAFAIDPTSLPLQRGPQHSERLFGAFQDCGPDRWGRMLIERAVRKKVLDQKPCRAGSLDRQPRGRVRGQIGGLAGGAQAGHRRATASSPPRHLSRNIS